MRSSIDRRLSRPRFPHISASMLSSTFLSLLGITPQTPLALVVLHSESGLFPLLPLRGASLFLLRAFHTEAGPKTMQRSSAPEPVQV